MPPSSDDLPGRKPPRKQRRAAERAEKNMRGKQPGSPGASMTRAVPDRTEDHRPGGACSCGRDLADAADLGVARSYQQEEIPAATAERVQHDLHEASCACGRARAAARPAGVPDSALSVGPQTAGPGRLPGRLPACPGGAVPAADRRRHRRCRIGRVHPFLLRQAAGLAAEVVRLIRALITAAAAAGFDETTPRSGPAGEEDVRHGAFAGCCAALKMPMKAAFTMPMENRTIRAVSWARCRATSARCRNRRRPGAGRSARTVAMRGDARQRAGGSREWRWRVSRPVTGSAAGRGSAP